MAPSAQQLQQSADAQSAPLLAQLKMDPNNPSLLTQLGNIAYDAKQYPAAIDYYQRVLKLRPADTSVRTDMGTAYWFIGNADAAIEQFNKALSYEPTKPDTLFNLGIVESQGKKDSEGAIAAWQKLLAANPNYENKEAVLQLIAQARNH
jgi:tetratricopeptide (TPR) repeat protein